MRAGAKSRPYAVLSRVVFRRAVSSSRCPDGAQRPRVVRLRPRGWVASGRATSYAAVSGLAVAGCALCGCEPEGRAVSVVRREQAPGLCSVGLRFGLRGPGLGRVEQASGRLCGVGLSADRAELPRRCPTAWRGARLRRCWRSGLCGTRAVRPRLCRPDGGASPDGCGSARVSDRDVRPRGACVSVRVRTLTVCGSTCIPTPPHPMARTRRRNWSGQAKAAGLDVVAHHRSRHGGWLGRGGGCALPVGLTLVPGTEFSCAWFGANGARIGLHLLGYLYDPDDEESAV